MIQGKGINDAPYKVKLKKDGKIYWRCPIYSRWENLMMRAYSEAYHKRNPSYTGTEVCEEWKTFSNFSRWLTPRYFEGCVIDKDIKNPCKIYSPETCLVVTTKTNNFVVATEKKKVDSELPIGVVFASNNESYTYMVQVTVHGKYKYLGYTNCPVEGSRIYLKNKIQLCEEVIQEQHTEENKEGLRMYQTRLITRLEELN